MTNNDVFRRVRYILELSDNKMIKIFALSNMEVSTEQVNQWLKKDDEPDYSTCNDLNFANFLDGLIIEKRGAKDGPQPEPEKILTNNIIFKKLKIAFNLKAEDVIAVLNLAELTISKHELSAFFRKPEHKNYRECKDQILRNFLTGLQFKFRGK